MFDTKLQKSYPCVGHGYIKQVTNIAAAHYDTQAVSAKSWDLVAWPSIENK